MPPLPVSRPLLTVRLLARLPASCSVPPRTRVPPVKPFVPPSVSQPLPVFTSGLAGVDLAHVLERAGLEVEHINVRGRAKVVTEQVQRAAV